MNLKPFTKLIFTAETKSFIIDQALQGSVNVINDLDVSDPEMREVRYSLALEGNPVALEGLDPEFIKNASLEKVAHQRWTAEDAQSLKEMFTTSRQEGVPHKQIWREIARRLRRSPSEVQRKLIRMYKNDPELSSLKQEVWSKERILEDLKNLYLDNQPMNKNKLPNKLQFILLKVTPPSAPQHREYFPSIDHAVAEAIHSCGFSRNEDGSLDQESPIETIEEALDYVRLGHKRRHVWNLDEVRNILTALNSADYPITLPFLTNHYSIYKSALGVNRKLESFKDVVKKFVEDGSIKSYADLICDIAPEYSEYYNESKSRLKLSTEEIRVKKFLDRYRVSYTIPRLTDKMATGLDDFENFVPDFILLDENKQPCAIIEVFGSIGDRENSGVGSQYQEKTQAKIQFYNSLPNTKFIEIYNNGARCDLDDDSLFQRFANYIKLGSNIDVQDIISADIAQVADTLDRFGCSIFYSKQAKQYHLFTKHGQVEAFNSLKDISTLSRKNPAFKQLLDQIVENNKSNKYYRKQKFPGEQGNDYQPLSKDDSNRQISFIDHQDHYQ